LQIQGLWAMMEGYAGTSCGRIRLMQSFPARNPCYDNASLVEESGRQGRMRRAAYAIASLLWKVRERAPSDSDGE
jgi:hypothetical protein